MLLRSVMISALLSILPAMPAEAKKAHAAPRTAKIRPVQFVVQPDLTTRVDQSRAARWGWTPVNASYEGDRGNAMQLRWRLTKMTMKVPLDLSR